MSTQEVTLLELHCDGDECDEKLTDSEWGNEIVEEDADRIREIAEDFHWGRDGDEDLCPACMCARHDHQRRTSTDGTYTYCGRCNETLLVAVTAEPKAAFL